MQQPLELGEVLGRQQPQVAVGHFTGKREGIPACPRGFGGLDEIELQQEALGDVACAHAGGIEALQQFQCRTDLLGLDVE